MLACYINHFVQCQSRDLPLSIIMIPSFTSCFTSFYCLDPYFIFKVIILNILVYLLLFFCYSIQLYMYNCSIRVTAILEYLIQNSQPVKKNGALKKAMVKKM